MHPSRDDGVSVGSTLNQSFAGRQNQDKDRKLNSSRYL